MIATLNIPDSEVNDLTEFLCQVYDYQVNIYNPKNNLEQIPNPESREQFANRVIIFPLKMGFDDWLTRRAVKNSDITSNITLKSIE